MAKCNFKLRLPSIRICRSKKSSSLPKNPSKLPLPGPGTAISFPVTPNMLLPAPPSAKSSHPPRFKRIPLMSGCISKVGSVYVSTLSNKNNKESPALPKLCNSPVSEDLEEIPLPAVSFSSADGGRSDQDEELISSSSSFDSSSDSGYAPKTKTKKKNGMSKRQSTMATLPEDKSAAGMKVKMNESYAMRKKSEDPHDDFKKSMMEMIEEKDLSESSEELEDLLMCFLSLNAKDHHAVILEAFSEVWDDLFSTVYFPSTRLISSLSK